MKRMHLRHVLSIASLLVTGTAVAQSPSGSDSESPASVAPAAPPAPTQVQVAPAPVTSPAQVQVAPAPVIAPAAPELLVPSNAGVQAAKPTQEQKMRTKLVMESGLLDPMYHRIQFGRGGTQFDYVKDGGQDVVFPTWRMSVESFWKRRHGLVFLYQPIDIRTQEKLREDLVVDNVRFPAGTPTNFRYGFDFYRVSYLYNFLSESEDDELSLGGSLQIRNAIIDFTSVDGQLNRSNRDIGPVPAVKSRGRWHVSDQAWLGYEVDGMYAPVKYINGGKSDVVGAIVDLSLRAGYRVASPVDVFFNFRYFGGGASGTSKSDAARGPGDGYTSNWLHFLTSTVGFEVKLEKLFDR